MTKMPRQKLKYLEKVKGSYDEIKRILSKYEVRLVSPVWLDEVKYVLLPH